MGSNNSESMKPVFLSRTNTTTGDSSAPTSPEQPWLPEQAGPDGPEVDPSHPVETAPASEDETETVAALPDSGLDANHSSVMDQATTDQGHGQVATAEADQGQRPVQAARKNAKDQARAKRAKKSRAKNTIALVVPDSKLDDFATFPIEVYTASHQAYIHEVASSIGCSQDFVGSAMLAVAGCAIGNSRALELKPGFSESPRLYMALVGPPGDGKTPAISRCLAGPWSVS